MFPVIIVRPWFN